MKKKKLYYKIDRYLYSKELEGGATVEELANHFDEPLGKIKTVLNKLSEDGRIARYKGKYCYFNPLYFM